MRLSGLKPPKLKKSCWIFRRSCAGKQTKTASRHLSPRVPAPPFSFIPPPKIDAITKGAAGPSWQTHINLRWGASAPPAVRPAGKQVGQRRLTVACTMQGGAVQVADQRFRRKQISGAGLNPRRAEGESHRNAAPIGA
jgi:hypothetical protein